MELLVPVDIRRTIDQFAHYVLDDPKVKAFIEKFTTYQKTNDKLIDSLEELIDSAGLTFDNEEELKVAREFLRNAEARKNETLRKLIVDIEPLGDVITGLPVFDAISKNNIRRRERLAIASQSDVPLLVFREFALSDEFKDYLFKGSVPWMSSAYFAKDMDLAQQKYMVFATFVWAAMVEEVTQEAKFLYNFRLTFHYDYLINFLSFFKDYIHYDLWDEGDYTKRGKTGTVLRLALDTTETGSVVVQECGDMPISCNKTIFLDRESMYALKEAFEKKQLMRLNTSLRCQHCMKQAHFLARQDNQNAYYCSQRCFNCCKK